MIIFSPITHTVLTFKNIFYFGKSSLARDQIHRNMIFLDKAKHYASNSFSLLQSFSGVWVQEVLIPLLVRVYFCFFIFHAQ